MATIGQQIDHYRVERLLGEGGMGAVFLAKDLNLQRNVALKVMHEQFAAQEQFQRRFIQEARAAAALKHDNIVQIYDCDIKDGHLFIAMENITGGSLRDYIQRNTQNSQINLDLAVEMVRQLAEALHYAHQRQMIHRDIKPDNVLLKEIDGAPPLKKLRPILTDFGLAKLLQGGMLDTALGETLGTPEYMSPEQCTNDKIDERSDIYAMGIMLFEMVTGRVPFPFRNMHDAMRDHTQTPVPNIQSLRPVDVELEKIIRTCLAKDPKDRYQTARELARDLEQFQQGPPAAATQIEEEPAAPYAGPVNIVVNDSGKEDKRYFDLNEINIGRADDQHLKLTGDKRVSRRHARITRSPQTGYQITDLGSGNGTLLDNQPLQAHVPTVWPLDSVVEVGPCTLRLEKAEARQQPPAAAPDFDPLMTRLDDLPTAPPPAAASAPAASSSLYETGLDAAPPPVPQTRVNPNPQPAPPRTRVNPNPQPAPAPMPQQDVAADDAIHVTLDNTVLMVETQRPTFLNVTVLNQSRLVDHFNIQVMGIPAEWYKVQTGDLRLMPGDKGVANIAFTVPRASSSTAGEHAVELRIDAVKQNLRPKTLNIIMIVQPFYEYETDLEPTLVKRRRTTLIITNKGNSTNTYNLAASDPAHDLDFEMGPRQVTLMAGERLQIPMIVRPKQRPFIGSSTQKPFEIEVTTSQVDRPPMPERGNLVIKPVIPRWMIMLIPLLLALCVGLALFAVSRMEQQQATATAQTAVAVQVDESASLTATAAADPDEDGLTTAQELALGTDPLNPDTDGDGLLDGEEVNIYGTDPKKRDTDGDTLDDGVEVDSGCLSPINPNTFGGGGPPDNVRFASGDPCTQPTPTETPLPAELAGCPDSPETRLKVGDRGQVEPGGRPNRLRADPSTDAELMEPPLQPGARFTIVGGPRCNTAEGGPLIRFWQVNTGGRIGWTAEGWLDDDADEDKYYLEPVTEE